MPSSQMSMIVRVLVLLFVLWSGAASAQLGGKSVVVTERTRAELLAHAPEGIEPGKPVWVGLQLAHQPEWHSYWKNSGDSGLPTKLEWKLPAGVLAGEIAGVSTRQATDARRAGIFRRVFFMVYWV